MHHRSIAFLALVCFALSAAGCESFWKDPSGKRPKKSASKKQYQEVRMPLQTGSVLQRRTYVMRGPESEKPAKKKKKEAAAPKPEAEPTATPTPEEEATPAPVERFR